MNNKLSATLANSKQYTLAVAAAMPDNGYSFKPADDVFNFGELLNHIAYGIEWWEANYVKGVKTEWAPPAVGNSKKEATAYLQKAYDALSKTISGALSDEAVSGFFAALDHITHHRGQATTYLRCKGINTPEYMY
ncbi:MAG: DinB family protein [Bacteroidota bacterium]